MSVDEGVSVNEGMSFNEEISVNEEMSVSEGTSHDSQDRFPEPPRKRHKPLSALSETTQSTTFQHCNGASSLGSHLGNSLDDEKEKSIKIVSAAKLAQQKVAPFLQRHIPQQYAPLTSLRNSDGVHSENKNSKFCYRHRPDMLCRRQADEPSMDKLQQDIDTLSQEDRQGIAHVWSLFSAAPSQHRNLMLQGILAQCCFPQLSFLAANVKDLIRINFLAALPTEVSFRILCFLDPTSLCRAAQVSRRWRQLADDDIVWHRMCEQHIDRKCAKCGWGLPLLDRKRLRASKRQIQLRAASRGINEWLPDITPNPEEFEGLPPTVEPLTDVTTSDHDSASVRSPSPVAGQKRPFTVESDYSRKTRPWKDVYKDRYKVGSNWKYGRCTTRIFSGHTNGVVSLQFNDSILATGSYDATIKIWDVETGEEIRTLTGHTSAVRCLQFDNTKLISGSLDSTIRIWNWRTGECLSIQRGHNGGVVSLQFDENILVSGSIDQTAKIWNFKDMSTFTLRGHTDWVNSVRIDSGSKTIFTASDDLTVRMWDLDTKRTLRTFEGHTGQVQQVLLLPHGFELDEEDLVAQDAHTDTPPGEQAQTLSEFGHQDLLPFDRHIQETFSNDQAHPNLPKYMLTSALDSTIRLWDVSTGRCVRTFFGHVEGVWGLAADTLRIVSGAEDRMVKIWDPRTGKCSRTFNGHAGPVTCVDLSDCRLCSGSEDGEVRMYTFNSD